MDLNLQKLDQIKAKPGSNNDVAGRAETLLTLRELEGLIQKFVKINPRPFADSVLSDFLSLPQSRRISIVGDWKAQIKFIRGAIELGIDAFDEVKMLEYAFSRLGMISTTGLLSEVSSDDVVEIYGADYVQVYRSYSYFSLCNYSLLELSAYPWFELYERPSAMSSVLFERAEKLLSEGLGYIDLSDLPEYTIKETKSLEGAAFLVREKCAFRVLSAVNGDPYLLSVKKAKELCETPSGRVRFI